MRSLARHVWSRQCRNKLALWLLASCLSGCSLVNFTTTTYHRDGEGRLDADAFDRITPEATRLTWLRQQFGEPLWADYAADGAAIYTWQFVREHHQRRDLILIFRYRKVTEEARYLHVVTQHEQVLRHWLDDEQHVDVQRVLYALGLHGKGETANVGAEILDAQPETPLPAVNPVLVEPVLDEPVVVEEVD